LPKNQFFTWLQPGIIYI